VVFDRTDDVSQHTLLLAHQQLKDFILQNASNLDNVSRLSRIGSFGCLILSSVLCITTDLRGCDQGGFGQAGCWIFGNPQYEYHGQHSGIN
jgi:hypothetical protein